MTEADPRKELIRYWVSRADEALASAKLEHSAAHYEAAVNRAYFACFYVLSALLLRENRRFVKHTGVRSALHSQLVKPGKLERRWGELYDRLFESRNRADYVDLVRFDQATATRLIDDARAFVGEIKRLLSSDL